MDNYAGRKLTLNEAVHPFAAKQALKQYGFLVTKELLPAEMKKTLDEPDGIG